MYGNGGLVIDSCRECLALLAWDSGVCLYELCHDTAHGLDTEGKRSNVEEYDIAYSTFLVEDGTLYAGTYSNNLIRIYAL